MTVNALLARTTIALLMFLPALPAVAAPPATSPASTTWIYPVIKDYGRVHPRPDAAVQPDPSADYKVIVDVISGEKDPAKVLGSLQRLARLMNVLGYAKVPAEHVHIVAVIEGEASYASASNATYRKHFKTDNPNLAILHALKSAGVELLVCSQAMAEHDIKDTDIGPDMTITLSALSDFVVYGQRGYSYMQL